MEITLNNETKIIESNSLNKLLGEVLGDKTKGIAVAINDAIVPKAKWESTFLNEKDCVLIIKATQGG